MAQKRWYLRKRLWIPILLGAGLYLYVRCNPLVFNESAWGHAHCIKITYFFFSEYADKHGGRFPSHPSGYPSALLLMEEAPGRFLTGPGFDGSVFDEARLTGRQVTEEECGRVYIQGLSKKSNPELIYLFDKIPTPGGDHCPLPFRMWQPLCREVLKIGGHERIDEAEWPAIVRNQIELLVQEGFDRKEAERLYNVTKDRE